jgi:hypothetical protein
VLSLPLLTPDGVFGAMNVYARARNGFDDHTVELGEMFAVPAAIAVQKAYVLDVARRLAINLQAALSAREVVDQALGVLRSSNGWRASEASSTCDRSVGHSMPRPRTSRRRWSTRPFGRRYAGALTAVRQVVDRAHRCGKRTSNGVA